MAAIEEGLVYSPPSETPLNLLCPVLLSQYFAKNKNNPEVKFVPHLVPLSTPKLSSFFFSHKHHPCVMHGRTLPREAQNTEPRLDLSSTPFPFCTSLYWERLFPLSCLTTLEAFGSPSPAAVLYLWLSSHTGFLVPSLLTTSLHISFHNTTFSAVSAEGERRTLYKSGTKALDWFLPKVVVFIQQPIVKLQGSSLHAYSKKSSSDAPQHI